LNLFIPPTLHGQFISAPFFQLPKRSRRRTDTNLPVDTFCLPLVRAGTQELDKTEPLASAAVNRHYTTLDDGDDDMSMGHLWDRKLSSATLFTTNPTFTATELTRVFQDVKMGVL
jgi:hypothetical protein